MADVAVNWQQYFESIKPVCPWSLSAWNKKEIHITNWQSHIIDLDSYQARIYIAPNHNPRQLKKMCNRFNTYRTNEEWLWSHPDFANHSTPVPVFIQQDRDKLTSIRLKNN